MTQVPVRDQTNQGYLTPRNTQFSVFLDNRCGKLLELVEVFDRDAVEILALSVVDSADHAVVRVVTSHAAKARELLTRHRLPFSEAEVLIVELGRGRSLAKLCTCLLSAEVNIHYAYPLMILPRGVPTIALHTDDQITAGQVLQRKLFTLLAESDFESNKGDLGECPETPPD